MGTDLQCTQSILICTQTFPPRLGGMEAVMYSLATRFCDTGFDVLVAADKPWNKPESFAILSAGVPRFMRSWFKRTQLSIRHFRPDITICDSWKSVSAVPKGNKRLIVLAHGQEYLSSSTKRRAAISKALARAELVIASSNMTAELVRQIARDKRIEVIYPTYMLKAPETVVNARNNAVPQILSLCRIEERKGLAQSAEALKQLSKKGIPFQWKIAGSGPDLQALKEKIENLGLSGHCEFLGRVSDPEKRELLDASDLYLMPSYQAGKSLEGFGISYVEAAMHGVASIAGEVGGAPEAVHQGSTGWCVDGSSPTAIAAVLSEALSRPDELKARGAAARARFDSELAGDLSFKRLLDLC